MEKLYPFPTDDDYDAAVRQQIVRRHNERNLVILCDEYMFYDPRAFENNECDEVSEEVQNSDNK